MSERNHKPILLILFALATVSSTGCATYGPSLGIWNYGIPVSPYFQDKKEREHWEHERYDRAPILGPISAVHIGILHTFSLDKCYMSI